MSDTIKGVVETSANLAIVKTTESTITLVSSQRGEIESALTFASDKTALAFGVAGVAQVYLERKFKMDFMEVQAEISAAKLQDRIGQEYLVLIDEVNSEGAVGRSYMDAPEVDGKVYLTDEFDVKPGDALYLAPEERVRIW